MNQDQRNRQQHTKRTKNRVGMLVGALILIVCVVVTLALTAEKNAPKTLADVEARECFRGRDLNDLEIVDCDQAHHGEMVAILAPADENAAYPGEDALHLQHDEACALEVEEYFGAGRDAVQQQGLQIFPVVPTEAQWNDDQKSSLCYVGSAQAGQTVSGSIEGLGAGATTTAPPATPAP